MHYICKQKNKTNRAGRVPGNTQIKKVMLQILAYLLGFKGILFFSSIILVFIIVGVFAENHRYNKWYDNYYKKY